MLHSDVWEAPKRKDLPARTLLVRREQPPGIRTVFLPTQALDLQKPRPLGERDERGGAWFNADIELVESCPLSLSPSLPLSLEAPLSE